MLVTSGGSGDCPRVGEAAEALHRGFLKHLLGVRISATSEIVHADFGRVSTANPFLAADFAVPP